MGTERVRLMRSWVALLLSQDFSLTTPLRSFPWVLPPLRPDASLWLRRLHHACASCLAQGQTGSEQRIFIGATPLGTRLQGRSGPDFLRRGPPRFATTARARRRTRAGGRRGLYATPGARRPESGAAAITTSPRRRANPLAHPQPHLHDPAPCRAGSPSGPPEAPGDLLRHRPNLPRSQRKRVTAPPIPRPSAHPTTLRRSPPAQPQPRLLDPRAPPPPPHGTPARPPRPTPSRPARLPSSQRARPPLVGGARAWGTPAPRHHLQRRNFQLPQEPSGASSTRDSRERKGKREVRAPRGASLIGVHAPRKTGQPELLQGGEDETLF